MKVILNATYIYVQYLKCTFLLRLHLTVNKLLVFSGTHLCFYFCHCPLVIELHGGY